MEITRRIEFDAGHRVPGHNGHCSSPHGHRYRLEITVDGRVPPDGMVIDFGIIKHLAMDLVHARFDHAMVVWEMDRALLDAMHTVRDWKVAVIDAPPTAENLARICGEILRPALRDNGVELVAVRLYETPNAWADWRPGDDT